MSNNDLVRSAGVVLSVALACPISATAAASDRTEPKRNGEAVMEAARARYSELQSLHQRCTWSHSPVEGEEPPDYIFGDFTQPSELFFKRPNRLRIVGDHLELFSNGTTMWIVDRARGIYTVGQPPEQLANVSHLIAANASPALDQAVLLALAMLFPDQSTSDCEPISSAEQIHLDLVEAEHDGIPGLLISDHSAGDEVPASTYWINPITSLIHRWELIAERTYHGDPEDPSDDVTGYSRTVIECSVVEPNPVFDDDQFEFSPTPDMRLVPTISTWFEDPVGTSFQERIAATVTLSEASVGSVSPELLISAETFRTGRVAARRPGHRVDINLDGTADLVMPGFQGEALVVDGATGETRVLRFSGRATGSNISMLAAVPMKGDTAWAVASAHHDTDFEQSRAVISLHGPDGEEWWVYSPELPEGQSSKARIAVADLDRDGNPEIVVGIRVFGRVPIGSSSYRHELHDSLLVILDTQGERVSQIVIKGALADLMIGGTRSDPMIVAVLDDQVITYRLSPSSVE